MIDLDINSMYAHVPIGFDNLCQEILVSREYTATFLLTPKSKYKFSRAKWYTAGFNWDDYDEVHAWCTEQFGPEPALVNQDAWTRWMHKYGDTIHFRDQQDYMWFVLRWGK